MTWKFSGFDLTTTDSVLRNIRDRDGLTTPLMDFLNRTEYKEISGFGIGDVLIEHKADVNAIGKNGRTALFQIARTGEDLSVEWLLENGADPNIHDDNKTLPIDVALFCCEFEDTLNEENEEISVDNIPFDPPYNFYEIVSLLRMDSKKPRRNPIFSDKRKFAIENGLDTIAWLLNNDESPLDDEINSLDDDSSLLEDDN